MRRLFGYYSPTRFGQASKAAGAEILEETKEKGSQMLLIMAILGLGLYASSRML